MAYGLKASSCHPLTKTGNNEADVSNVIKSVILGALFVGTEHILSCIDIQVRRTEIVHVNQMCKQDTKKEKE